MSSENSEGNDLINSDVDLNSDDVGNIDGDDNHDESDMNNDQENEIIDNTKGNNKQLKMKKILEFNEKMNRKGVIYMSRVPPYMKPSMIKKYFAKYGVERVYLTPEGENLRKHRESKGGNKRICYTEGWIEFADKKTAKMVAECFNNAKIGGKKRSFYAEDLWNLRYLPKFKWENLTEKMNYDRRMRAEKLRAELSVAKKAQDFYIEQVDKSKKIMGIKKFKDAKRQKQDIVDDFNEDNDGEQVEANDPKTIKLSRDDKDNIRRVFKQKKPKTQAKI